MKYIFVINSFTLKDEINEVIKVDNIYGKNTIQRGNSWINFHIVWCFYV